MAKKLTYKRFENGDFEGVLRLWEEESGWGGITQEQFSNWYIKTPYGPCLTILALDENKRIVGQTVFMPSRILVEGQEKKAARVLAPIISKEFRHNFRNAEHPFFGMYKAGLEAAEESGISVFYGFPDHSWLAVFKLFPRFGLPECLTADFDCRVLRFGDAEPVENKNLTVSVIEKFDSDFNSLWKEAVTNHPIRCGVVKDDKWLNWKNGGRLNFAVRNSQRILAGYISIDKKTFLIADILTANPEITPNVVLAAAHFLKRHEEFGIGEIKMMETNYLRSTIEKLGLEKIDFKFAFGTHVVNEATAFEKIQPNNWYFTPND